PPERAAVDAVSCVKARDASANLVNGAGEVVSEAGRQGDTEPRRYLGHRGQHPVHRVQADGSHPDADLAWAGVRLRDVSQLQYLGAPEAFVDDSAAHGHASSRK